MGCAVFANIPKNQKRIESNNPIIEANPSNFEELLVSLVADLPKLRRLQKQGPDFVKEFHGPKQVANSIWSGWLSRDQQTEPYSN
jgi:hypothetical protein